MPDYVLYELHVGTFTREGTFDAVIPGLAIRGTTFTGVTFNFPGGNDNSGSFALEQQ